MSIWDFFEHEKNVLTNDIEVEILIIGAGMTGLNTAYFLQDEDICVVDARTIGSGVTKKTTAKITYLQENIYSKIKTLRGLDASLNYLSSQIDAVKEYKKIIESENIDCDFVSTPSFIFASSKKQIKTLDKEYNFLKNEGINIYEANLPINKKVYKSYKVDDTYTFNPLKYLKGIYKILKTKNIKIYENTNIIKVKKEKDKYICFTEENNVIKCNKIIFASGYPYFIKPMYLPLKTCIEKSYILISKVNNYKNFSCINVGKPVYSCRYYKRGEDIYQISLGYSHNISIKQNDKKCFKKVQKEFDLKDKDIIMKYSNTDIMTPDNIPYIGEIKENMFIGCGYNTWGMTNSLLSGKILSDLIKRKSNKYKELFNPKRFNLANIVKLPLTLLSNGYSYITSKLIKNKYWYNKNIKCKNNIGIVIDEEGIEHKIINKCPHMGCGLIYNEEENTWDCPCHSSKFDIDGKCLKGPSKKDLIKIENED